MDLAKSTAEDEYRKRQDLVAVGLQNQIEELRRQLKEALSKANWLEEGQRQMNARLNEMAIAHEQYRKDTAQEDQARLMEEQRLKKLVAELQERVDQPIKPIRQLQAQMQDLAEQVRKDREQREVGTEHLDGLRQRITEAQSRLGLVEESQVHFQELVSQFQERIEEQKRAVARAQELWQIEVQRLLRQDLELGQAIEQTQKDRLDQAAKVQWLEEQRKSDRAEVERGITRLEFLEMEREQNAASIQRVADQLAGGDNAIRERLEQYRVLTAHELADLAHSMESKLERLAGLIGVCEERYRELDERLGLLPSHFERLKQRDIDLTGRIADLEEQRILRRMEQLQQELDEVRRPRE